MTRPPSSPPIYADHAASAAVPPAIVLYAQRERTRALMKTAFPRRRARVLVTRSVVDFQAAFKSELVDAAVVDIGSAHEDTWRVASHLGEYRSIELLGLVVVKSADG